MLEITKRVVQSFGGWREVFLSTLKAGDWVLLDEMNLISQFVLEGLNSVLDHTEEFSFQS
jgi:midasin (ATPase involved in ribosome maturation)